MVANTLLNPMIPTLKSTDSVGMALQWMDEFRIRQLALVDANTYRGIVTEDLLLDIPDAEALLSNIIVQHSDIYASEEQHVFELIKLANQFGLAILPVVHLDGAFAGTVLVTELFESFAKDFGVLDKGAIIVLKIAERDYSLSEISRLVESNDTKILSCYYSFGEGLQPTTDAKLTLKLNRSNITPLIATFERFGYQIEEAHSNDPIASVDQERLDMLMRYLAT